MHKMVPKYQAKPSGTRSTDLCVLSHGTTKHHCISSTSSKQPKQSIIECQVHNADLKEKLTDPKCSFPSFSESLHQLPDYVIMIGCVISDLRAVFAAAPGDAWTTTDIIVIVKATMAIEIHVSDDMVQYKLRLVAQSTGHMKRYIISTYLINSSEGIVDNGCGGARRAV
ncbi:hypothetical protein LguiA_034215 [Lonicera macranthoides]